MLYRFLESIFVKIDKCIKSQIPVNYAALKVQPRIKYPLHSHSGLNRIFKKNDSRSDYLPEAVLPLLLPVLL